MGAERGARNSLSARALVPIEHGTHGKKAAPASPDGYRRDLADCGLKLYLPVPLEDGAISEHLTAKMAFLCSGAETCRRGGIVEIRISFRHDRLGLWKCISFAIW